MIALKLNDGDENVGKPNQSALFTPSKLTSPIIQAATYPITKPPKMLIRPKKPRKNALINPIDKRVIKPRR